MSVSNQNLFGFLIHRFYHKQKNQTIIQVAPQNFKRIKLRTPCDYIRNGIIEFIDRYANEGGYTKSKIHKYKYKNVQQSTKTDLNGIYFVSSSSK